MAEGQTADMQKINLEQELKKYESEKIEANNKKVIKK